MTILDYQQRGQIGAQAEPCEADLTQLPVCPNHAWLAALLRAAMDGVIISDSKLRVVLLNAEAQRLFGYRPDQLIGCDIGALFATGS